MIENMSMEESSAACYSSSCLLLEKEWKNKAYVPSEGQRKKRRFEGCNDGVGGQNGNFNGVWVAAIRNQNTLCLKNKWPDLLLFCLL